MDIEEHIELSLNRHRLRMSRLRVQITRILGKNGAVDFFETTIVLSMEYDSRRKKLVHDLLQEYDSLTENKFSQYYQTEIELQNKFDENLVQIETEFSHMLRYRIKFDVR